MTSTAWRVLVAPDSFKGSIDARAAAGAIAEGWLSVRPDDGVETAPMADGGEGTLDAFEAAVPRARRIPVTVTGPHDLPVHSSWLLLPPTVEAPRGTGVVELANTSGIELLGSSLHPLTAHTRGFGQAIAAALDQGVSRLVLGIGSSASTDMGIGMLTELGARFLDEDGRPVPNGAGGLPHVARADLSQLRMQPEAGVVVLTDVTNPLVGSDGASRVFGPQKGMSDQVIATTDVAMRYAAGLLPADADAPGAGAAGGVGFALMGWGASVVSGATAISDLTGLADRIRRADFVITGEGSYDAQSARGKAPFVVTQLARAAGVPVGLVAGRITSSAPLADYHTALSLTDLAGSPDAALSSPRSWLFAAGRDLAAHTRRQDTTSRGPLSA